MNRKRRLWIIIGIGIVFTVVVGLIAFRLTLVCCALPPTPPTLTAIATLLTQNANLEVNQTTEAQLHQTQTTVHETALALVITATPSSYPYDPTLYAQRRHEEQVLQTGAGPTQYAIFFATETGIVATYQGTVPPTSTPIPYTADMSPTVTPTPRPIRTATPTLCPPSDVICPGGNATMSAADKVMVLMASAKAPEFGQLAQTATALAVTPTPTPTSASVHDSNCAFSWAHQDLPEIAKAAREAFSTISSAKIEVLRADAYGENCNRADGSLSYFAAMTTDFYLSADVTNLTDTRQMAQVVMTAYGVLTELKVKLPARAGYLDIVFAAGGEEKRFRAMISQIKGLIETKADDQKLLAAGGM